LEVAGTYNLLKYLKDFNRVFILFWQYVNFVVKTAIAGRIKKTSKLEHLLVNIYTSK